MINIPRRCGHTTHMLQSAIMNPEVIIIAANANHAHELQKQYNALKANRPWWKKILSRLLYGKKANKEPIFISIERLSYALPPRPWLFDNYTLSELYQRR